MTGRKALMGLSLLCALAFIALSAASASSATTEGTTAYTCAPDATNHGDFTDAHCNTTAATTGTGAFKHVAITETTEVTVTNENTKNATTESTNATLEATIGGIATKLEAGSVDSTCSLTNRKGTPDEATLSECVLTYTGVTVVNPANCTVHSPGQAAGTVKTTKLMGSQVGAGKLPMEVKVESETPTEFTKLEFAGASCVLNGVAATVNGTALGTPSGQSEMTNGAGHLTRTSGAILVFNVTKASAQLKIGGQNAALTATTTVKMVGGSPIGTTEEFIP